MKKINQKGFTLIELLVVIAIIGLLSTLAVVALNNARSKSRDARRLSDIKQIQTALELYYNDAGGYPAAITAGSALSSGTVTYMGTVPAAPTPADGSSCQTSNPYTYTAIGNSPFSSYKITYCLGGAVGDIEVGLNTATPSGIDCDTGTTCGQ